MGALDTTTDKLSVVMRLLRLFLYDDLLFQSDITVFFSPACPNILKIEAAGSWHISAFI
jgi:hypothetical protein